MKTFSKQLAKNNYKPGNPRLCRELQNSDWRGLARLNPCPSKDDREAKVNCRGGSRRDAEKEAIVQVQSSF